jgi:hypothetical protein
MFMNTLNAEYNVVHGILSAIDGTRGASFATFTYQTKETGEVAKYNIILGATTETLYRKDVPRLERIVKLLKSIKAQDHTIKAAEELLASRNESLTKGVGNNSAYTNADTYDYIEGLTGVRVHRETGALYVSGLLNRKEVISAGTPRKAVKSAPKTIAKRRIGYMLPSGRYRMFSLHDVTRAALRGNVLELAGPLDNDAGSV